MSLLEASRTTTQKAQDALRDAISIFRVPERLPTMLSYRGSDLHHIVSGDPVSRDIWLEVLLTNIPRG